MCYEVKLKIQEMGNLISKKSYTTDELGIMENSKMSSWNCVVQLSSSRLLIKGSKASLSNAIRRGADLSIYTEFRPNEHIDVTSDNSELVQEASEFPVTNLLDNHWVAGIMSLRQPISLPRACPLILPGGLFLFHQVVQLYSVAYMKYFRRTVCPRQK